MATASAPDATLAAMVDNLLRPFLGSPQEAGIFLDFDGTLSEIVHLPGDARPLAGTHELLEELGSAYKVLAIVSGRSADQLVEWLGPNIEIWGVHGLQYAHEGSTEWHDSAQPYLELMSRARREASRRLEELGIEGAFLEDKGVMLGLHFRGASQRREAEAALDAVADDLVSMFGLRRAGGRLAFELRPPIEVSKSIVVLDRSRTAGLRAVAFAGDDRVDLGGYDALDELAAEGVTTLRIAVDSREAPPELLERADVVVPGPGEAAAFLRTLIPRG